jgi:signal transduction histidine kinase
MSEAPTKQGLLMRLWDWLTAPFVALPRIEERRKAVITAAFALVSVLSVIAEQIGAGNTPFILVPILGGVYFLARTRWYKVAMLILLAGLIFPSYNVAIKLEQPSANQILASFIWVNIPIILASLIYSIRSTGLLVSANILVMLALPWFQPTLSYQVIYGALGFIIMTSAIVLIVMHQREQIERDRQQELRANQERLQLEIAERQRMEAEVRSLNTILEQRVLERTEQLARVNKELEAFTSSVSHDLRAPLRAINSYARILLSDFSANMNDEVRGFLEKIVTNGRQMNTLIDDLLAFARLGRESLSIGPVDMQKLVRDVIQVLEPETTGRAITWQIADLPSCQGDANLLRQVFLNLVNNALKYSRPRDLAHIEIGVLEQNGETVYFVRDDGVGFDMAYAEKLFAIFTRLHRQDEFEGTGIGLSTVHRILEKHGGRIWAHSAVGQGATFFFTINNSVNNQNL